jgi:multidrug resistance efflux pump
VRKFYVNRGDRSNKANCCGTRDSDLAAAVADAKGALDQAQAGYQNIASATVPDELVKSQQDVSAAKQSMEASQALLQSREQLFKEGALAKKLVDEAAVAYAQAKSQYETAQSIWNPCRVSDGTRKSREQPASSIPPKASMQRRWRSSPMRRLKVRYPEW